MKIYCTAYPRSGTTWLVRLLSDLLDSPQSGSEVLEPLIWGTRSDGDYTIVKTHWRADQYHKSDNKIVVSQRDPRDVAVSAMYYRELEPTDDNLMVILKSMISEHSKVNNPIYHIKGWYRKWYQSWLDSNKYDVLTRYELLSDLSELRRIVYELTGKTLTEDRIRQSMERQSFENQASKFPHSMRKGIVGDWRNHFKIEHCEYITENLGEFMVSQGYVDNLEWF